MQVILTDDVLGLGDIGDAVTVKPGYARNFLIPRGLAFEAGSANAKSIEHKMRQVNAKKTALKSEAEGKAEDIRNLVLKATLRVGKGGKVFGSLGPKDIQKLLAAEGHEYDRRRVVLAEPIRKVGMHFVSLKLHAEVTAQFKLEVEGLAATAKEESKEADEAKEKIEEASAESEEAIEEVELASEPVEPEVAAAAAS